ncbi:MAG TPA: site-2 protease family protein [Ilumatobacteraceae bacterium]|nr:site-2 protease family protein [Ilumatobacteraceae bacterium]
MFSTSIPLGRLAGAPLRLHWSAVLVGVLLGVMLAPANGVVTAVFVVLAFFASITGHEAAHAYVARRHGIATTSIDLWALGGMARLEREPRTARAEGWIAAAGPLASLAIGIVGLGAGAALLALDAPVELARVVAFVGAVNILLAVFNLLPGAPLDGGRIVRAVRWGRHGNRYRAMREAGHAGRVIGWAVGGLGLWIVLVQRPNGIFLALTGLFIAMNARAEIVHADVAERLGGITVGQLTWYGIAEAGRDMDTDSMIWQRQRLGEAGAVVVRGDDGTLDGLVFEDQLWAVPVEQRPWTMLTSLMAPFNRLARADPDDELAAVLPRLNPLRPVVTVWRDGRLLGIVSPKVLREQMRRITAGPLPAPGR